MTKMRNKNCKKKVADDSVYYSAAEFDKIEFTFLLGYTLLAGMLTVEGFKWVGTGACFQLYRNEKMEFKAIFNLQNYADNV